MDELTDRRKIALIFGMHKSGLSVGAEMVKAFDFQLIGSEDVARLNADVLKHFNLSWSSVESITPQNLMTMPEEFANRAWVILNLALAAAPYLALKDPQFCRLMPFWSHVLSKFNIQTYCLIMSRHPFALANSLYISNNFDGEHTFALWRAHMLESSSFMHPAWKRIVLDYDRVLDDSVSELARISDLFEITTTFSKVQTFRESVKRSARHSFVNSAVHLLNHPEHQILWENLYRLSKGEPTPNPA